MRHFSAAKSSAKSSANSSLFELFKQVPQDLLDKIERRLCALQTLQNGDDSFAIFFAQIVLKIIDEKILEEIGRE